MRLRQGGFASEDRDRGNAVGGWIDSHFQCFGFFAGGSWGLAGGWVGRGILVESELPFVSCYKVIGLGSAWRVLVRWAKRGLLIWSELPYVSCYKVIWGGEDAVGLVRWVQRRFVGMVSQGVAGDALPRLRKVGPSSQGEGIISIPRQVDAISLG